jgi:alpha-D-ribose 1-methylphosphonate 5-triphosphate diphosphatase PhnM
MGFMVCPSFRMIGAKWKTGPILALFSLFRHPPGARVFGKVPVFYQQEYEYAQRETGTSGGEAFSAERLMKERRRYRGVPETPSFFTCLFP